MKWLDSTDATRTSGDAGPLADRVGQGELQKDTPSTPDRRRRRPIPPQVFRLWLPLGVLLLGYLAAQLVNGVIGDRIEQGTPNALGFGLHLAEPAAVDRWLFGGRLPTSWLQDRFHGPTSPHWYDAVAALIYVSHFLVIPAVALVLWFRDRARFRDWLSCVLLMAGVGIVI